MPKIIFFIILLSVTYFSHAQNNNLSTDTLLAKQYKEIAEKFMQANQMDSAIAYWQQAIPIFEQTQNWQQYTKCLYNLGKSYDIKGKPEEAYPYFYKAIQKTLELLPDSIVFLSKNYNYLAHIYTWKIKILDSAKINLEKTIQLLENKIENKDLGFAYRQLGAIFLRQSYLKKSAHYLNKGYNLCKKLGEENKAIGILSDLSILYRIEGNTELAIQTYKDIINHPKANIANKKIAYSNITNSFIEREEFSEALKYVNKAITTIDSSKQKSWLSSAYTGKAVIYKRQKKWPEAEKYIKKAIQLQEAQNRVGNDRDLARSFQSLGDIYTAQNKFEKALATHQKSLQTHIPIFTPTDNNINPTLESLQKYSSEPRIIESLGAKAETLHKKYKTAKNIEDLKIALVTYQLAIEQTEMVTYQLAADESKAIINEIFYAFHEQAVQAALTLHQLTNEQHYLEQVLQIVEKSKANILLEAIKKMEAQQQSEIPDSLLQQESQYKQHIAFFDIKKQQDATQTMAYNDSIFKYSRALEKLQSQLKNAYPTYTNYTKNISIATLPQLQTQLKKDGANKAILEYFIGDSTLYTFAITSDSFWLTTTPIDSTFNQNITNILSQLKTPQTDAENYQIYVNIAYQLYEKLIAPILSQKPDNQLIEELLIIPDGQLAYLPFEALIQQYPTDTEAANKGNKYRKLDYLLQTYNISYAHSATLWLESLHKTSNKQQAISHNYLGFSPKFVLSPDSLVTKDCENEVLPPLKLQHSITDICQLLGGQAYANEQASKQTFTTNSHTAKILHLYTHACISDTDPMQNQIFFTDAPAFNYELYGLQFNADLAVLTACETGTGELIKGEGIMSLSRAFMYGGCPSVVTSLWKVQEKTTQIITQNFYENIYNKYTKDKALHQAKIHFLNHQSTNKTAHPTYWAAFVHIGNHQAIDLGSQNWMTYILWLLVLIGLMLFFVFIYKQYTTKAK